jgi:hypothetical protein
LSPGFSVLVIAASQAAVPEPGKMKTSPVVGAHHALEVGKQAQRQIAEIRGAHVLHAGTFMARRTSSGTLVGPGMNRWV